MELKVSDEINSPKLIFSDNTFPLVVDLDGTLIKTDLLHEGFIMLMKKNPLYFFACLFWLLKGKAFLKNKIETLVHLRYDLLPYNNELIDFLQNEFTNGRTIILATASNGANANRIAKQHPIFEEVYATEELNLKGTNKVKKLIATFGESKFDYIGNSGADIPVFSSCRYSYLVNPSQALERKTKKLSDLKYSWKSKKTGLKNYIKAIRIYQWIKNLLIFVPLITSHSLTSFQLLKEATAAFFAFGFVASSGYLINDLMDLNSDRAHPRKRFRPFASGQLPILNGFVLSIVFFVAGIFLASQLNTAFLIILFIYFIISFSYSAYFKKMILYDVFVLTILYSSRVIAGGLVTGVSLSFWLIAFSTFIFLSLAFVKRYAELMKVTTETGLKERGREYLPADLNLLQVMGIVSGFLSVVVFTLYIDSHEVAQLYSHPKILWSISFLFLFWISRIWVVTTHGKMTDDPLIFAVKDATSYFIFLIIGIIMWLSI